MSNEFYQELATFVNKVNGWLDLKLIAAFKNAETSESEARLECQTDPLAVCMRQLQGHLES